MFSKNQWWESLCIIVIFAEEILKKAKFEREEGREEGTEERREGTKISNNSDSSKIFLFWL